MPRITLLSLGLNGRGFSDYPRTLGKLYITDYLDYSHDSIWAALNSSNASIVFSFLHSNDPGVYNEAHGAMLFKPVGNANASYHVSMEVTLRITGIRFCRASMSQLTWLFAGSWKPRRLLNGPW